MMAAVEEQHPLVALTDEPAHVADAIDRIGRIVAIRGWLHDLEQPIRDWLDSRADQSETELGPGTSFRAHVDGVGKVLKTRPEPTPSIADQEQFARWYVESLLDKDPDEAEEDQVYRFDDHALRRLTATAGSADLIRWLNAVTETPDDDTARMADITNTLVGAIQVDVEWLVGEATLESLLDGSHYLCTDRQPLLKVVAGSQVVDGDGQVVPGTRVKPASARALQVTILPDRKRQLRQELEALIGSPALRDG